MKCFRRYMRNADIIIPWLNLMAKDFNGIRQISSCNPEKRCNVPVLFRIHCIGSNTGRLGNFQLMGRICQSDRLGGKVPSNCHHDWVAPLKTEKTLIITKMDVLT